MALVLLCVALCGNRHISSLAVVGLLAVRSGYNFCSFVKAEMCGGKQLCKAAAAAAAL